MSIDTTKPVVAEEVETGDELDFDGDDYADNEMSIFGFAAVNNISHWWDGESGSPMVTLYTSQGDFEMPAGHFVKLKTVE